MNNKIKSLPPTREARKEMMACARSKKNPDNGFFIERATGKIHSRAYRGKDSYFPEIPRGTYEVYIPKNPFLSYAELDEYINEIMSIVEMGDMGI